MARLWIILLVIWYRAFTLAKSEIADSYSEKHQLEFLFDSKDHNGAINSENSVDSDKVNRNKRAYNTLDDEHKDSAKIDVLDMPNLSVTGPPENYEKISPVLPQYNPVDWYVEQCLNSVSKRKFNSWGGKRAPYYANSYDDQHLLDCINFLAQSMEYLNDNDDEYKITNDPNKIDSNARNKKGFHSWGGKRSTDDQMTPKRLPFRAWGGKRDNSIEALTPKRLPFKAWGGKRSPEKFAYPVYSVNDEPRIDRIAMLSLTENYPEANEKRVNRKKTKFHSWGGKRSFDDSEMSSLADRDPMEELLSTDINGGSRRKLKFSSWGGKRSNMNELINDSEDKRTFHSWGGKRTADDLILDDYPSYETYKRTFHSWGGK